MRAGNHDSSRADAPSDGVTRSPGGDYPPARYVGPMDLGTPGGRHERAPARVTLTASYASQLLVWRDGPVRRVVRTGPAGLPAGEHPWGRPVLVMSAWNADGAARTWEQNDAAQRRLAQRVSELGGVVRGRLVLVPPDRGWAEEALVVTGIDRDGATALARESGQAAFADWDDEYLSVVPTGLVADVEPSRRAWQVVEEPVTCPMRLDEQDGALCKAVGGPWVSASIHASGVWQSHRALMTSLLGCEPCADGRGRVRGPGGGRGAIAVVPIKLGSRHGGYVW
jgi:hypothetical protein